MYSVPSHSAQSNLNKKVATNVHVCIQTGVTRFVQVQAERSTELNVNCRFQKGFNRGTTRESVLPITYRSESEAGH